MMFYFMARNMSKSLKSVPKKTTKKPSDPFASFNVFKVFIHVVKILFSTVKMREILL